MAMPVDQRRMTIWIDSWELSIYDGDAPSPPATLEERFEGDSPLMQVRAAHLTRGLTLVVTLSADSFHSGDPHRPKKGNRARWRSALVSAARNLLSL